MLCQTKVRAYYQDSFLEATQDVLLRLPTLLAAQATAALTADTKAARRGLSDVTNVTRTQPADKPKPQPQAQPDGLKRITRRAAELLQQAKAGRSPTNLAHHPTPPITEVTVRPMQPRREEDRLATIAATNRYVRAMAAPAGAPPKRAKHVLLR